MKKNYLFLLFICCLSLSSMSGMNNNRDAKEIALKGNLPPKPQKSLVQPIQVFITDQFLEVDFNDSLGTIVISIYDEAGSAVYQQSVNSYGGQQLWIDITSFDAGEYTIEFVNSQGQYLCGWFEIF